MIDTIVVFGILFAIVMTGYVIYRILTRNISRESIDNRVE